MSNFLKKLLVPVLAAMVVALAATSFVGSATRPSTDFGSYVLLATELMRTRGVTVAAGNVGVNNGELQVRRDFIAPRSEVAAKTISFEPPFGLCQAGQLFATEGSSSCGPVTPMAPPVLGPGVFDLAEACGFPGRPIECNQNATGMFVGPGETVTLQPGTYGDVIMRGFGSETATLILSGGEYTFCSIRAGRDSRLVFAGAATVFVATDVRVGDRNYIGPAPGSTLQPSAIRFLMTGQRITFRQRAEARGVFCAPVGRVHVGTRAVVEGQLAAKTIRLDPGVLTGLSGTLSGGSTTTVPTTSSTTTTRLGCGNGIREGTEVCDPPDFGSATCPGSSVAGAFLQCRDACSRIDFNSCPGGPGSTSSTTSTSTSSSTSTSTSLPRSARCGDGIVNGSEVCDPPDFATATCPGSTVVGQSLGCSADCRQIDTSACPLTTAEICGNCVDDDGNGLTDFEDPACCAQVRTFRMTLSRARIIPGTGSSRLRLRSILARAGLVRVDPRVQDVFLQVKPLQGPDVLCAQVPASRFVAKGRTFRFVDKLGTVSQARGLSAVTVRIKSDASVSFRAKGKQVRLGDTHERSLQVTVGFRGAGSAGGESRCSTTTQAFRSSRKGGLLAP